MAGIQMSLSGLPFWSFDTGEILVGSTYISVEADLSQIPLYFKEGGIPMSGVSQFVKAGSPEETVLYMYPREEGSSYEYYEDDGISMGFEEEHTITNVYDRIMCESIEIRLRRTTEGYLEASKSYKIRVVVDGFKDVWVNNQLIESAYVEDEIMK